MSSTNLISIITPTYNSEKYLEETILSVLNQSYKHYEHIIIDGGSTDKTLEIISRYPHIKLITGKDNGMYDAINKGIKAASGDIIGCLNSDDLYFQNTLEVVNDFFSKNPHETVINGNAVYINSKSEELFKIRPIKYNYQNFIALQVSIICFPTVFWRKTMHEKTGYFDDNYKIIADYEFYGRIGRYYTITAINQDLAKFRLHPESLIIRQHALREQEMVKILAGFNTNPHNIITKLRRIYTLTVYYFKNLSSLLIYWLKKKLKLIQY